MPRGNGGVIGPANIPTTSVATGVWSLSELTLAVRQSIWPSAAALDPYFEYTTLLLPGNGTNGAQNNTFLDGSTNNFTITRNGNTTQGTFSPFSQTGWGNYFDGTGDYLATPTTQTPLTLNTDDFTLECWYYLPTQVQANTSLISSSNSSSITNALLIQLNTTTNAWELYINGTNLLVSASGRSATLNTWQHIAVTRSGSTFNFYLNGVAATGVSTSSASISVANWLIGYWYLAAHALTGYISNLRIVKGVVVYTGNFTPPTSPLAATQSAGTNISAITGTQTSLLTCQSNRFIDNSTNNFTITRNGDTRVVAFSPFNPTASWSAATYGGSGYFDGSGDNLKVSNNAAFQFGTTAFTIEFWAYLTTTSGSPQFICCYQNSSTGYNITLNASAVLTCNLSGDGADITGTTTVQANQWNHIALSGTGGTSVKLFLNGVQEGSTFTGSTSLSPGTYPFTIGSFAGGGFSDANFLTGYMSDVRVIKGTALYTSNFTPPTAPLTAITNTSLLLNFTNAGIYDATSKNDLETVGNAQISTTQSKWGGSSISFDGTGDWLLIPDQPPQRIGTGNFTVEMWVYRNSSGTYGLAGKGTGTTGWLVSLNSSNQVVFTYGSSTITSSGTVSATTWTHIAVVREGTSTNQTKIYINGTNDGTGTVSTDFNQTNSMYIGADRTGGSAANAYVQDVRITNYARYTANFTAPTAAFLTL